MGLLASAYQLTRLEKPLEHYLTARDPATSLEPGPQRAPASLGGSGGASGLPVNLTSACNDFYHVICGGERRTTTDPTGSVLPEGQGEELASKILEQIGKEQPFLTAEETRDELIQRIYTPDARTRIITAFQWVEKALTEFIEAQPERVFTSREKRQLLRRVHRVQLELPPPAKLYVNEPELLLKNDVFYERSMNGQLKLKVGGGFVLAVGSWFNLVFTIAHEFAHSIDPCEIRSARLAYPAYDRLTACFLRHNLIATRKTRSECGANDQLSETFADWIAAQVSAKALKAFSKEYGGEELMSAVTNTVRDLCEDEASPYEADTQLHPAPEVRIEGIFGRNPQVRELLGCPKTKGPYRPYCRF